MINIKEKLTHLMRTLTGRRHANEDREMPIESAVESGRAQNASARHPRRDADIPLDQIANTYTPTQTSLKAGFRASGADQQRDQEFASGVADERWNDEDRFTNKSGDPRIGTHGRTYEPAESREKNEQGGR